MQDSDLLVNSKGEITSIQLRILLTLVAIAQTPVRLSQTAASTT